MALDLPGRTSSLRVTLRPLLFPPLPTGAGGFRLVLISLWLHNPLLASHQENSFLCLFLSIVGDISIFLVESLTDNTGLSVTLKLRNGGFPAAGLSRALSVRLWRWQKAVHERLRKPSVRELWCW